MEFMLPRPNSFKRKRLGLDCKAKTQCRDMGVCISRMAGRTGSNSSSVSPVTTPDLPGEKAARIETLKFRFAETIEKAKQKMGLNHEKHAAGKYLKGFNSAKRVSELDIRMAKRREEMRRQREREAARLSIESVVKTVEFDDGVAIQREFLKLLFFTVEKTIPVMGEELEDREIQM